MSVSVRFNLDLVNDMTMLTKKNGNIVIGANPGSRKGLQLRSVNQNRPSPFARPAGFRCVDHSLRIAGRLPF